LFNTFMGDFGVLGGMGRLAALRPQSSSVEFAAQAARGPNGPCGCSRAENGCFGWLTLTGSWLELLES
jgi:hypothetical protein